MTSDASHQARKLVVSLLRAKRRPLVLSLAGSLGYLLTLLALPLVVARAVDTAVIGQDPSALGGIVSLLVALAAARAGFGVVRKYFANALMAGVGADLRNRMYAHMQRLSFSDHQRFGVGQLLARCSSDVTLVENMAAAGPFFVQSLVVGAGGMVVLLALHPGLTGAVCATAVVTGGLALSAARPIYSRSMALQEATERFTSFAEQQVHGIRIVKGHGLEGVGAATGAVHASNIKVAGESLASSRAWFLTLFLVSPASASVVVLGYGGHLALQGELTAGEVLAFIQYLGLLITPLMVLAQLLSMWPQARSALDRLAEVLGTWPAVAEPADPWRLPDGPGTVSFRDVVFGYEPDRPALTGVTIDVPGGTSLALVGASGSGKTTLTALVPRFYDPWSGSVTVDGVSTCDLSLDELRRAVSIVFEDTVVFATSIFENIAMSRPEATPEEVLNAARLARVDEFACELPDGWWTEVGDDGMSLSGGQRQRVAIARALLRQPRILILDDATSSLDPHLSVKVEAGLAEVMRGRTTLLIAHYEETARRADRVALLDAGRVVVTGTHEELLSLPAYRTALGLDIEATDEGPQKATA